MNHQSPSPSPSPSDRGARWALSTITNLQRLVQQEGVEAAQQALQACMGVLGQAAWAISPPPPAGALEALLDGLNQLPERTPAKQS